MPRLVIYRKYRPKTFSEVVGQEHIVKTLTNAVVSDMVSHAYLFTGPRGTGKTTMARLLAKAVNCENRKKGDFEPCNQCDSCREINRGNSIDLIEIDAASNRGIDEIRALKNGIRFVPTKSKYKVFIIDESHQLTSGAANALLKTLEEPPSHAIFILATTEAHKMIPTIISRCQRFDFRKLRMPEIISQLKKILGEEKIKFEENALSLIASSANGSIRDAESLLDEAISFSGQGGLIKKSQVMALLGAVDTKKIFSFLQFIHQNKAKEAIEFLDQIIYQGADIKEFTKSLIQYLREMLLIKIAPTVKDPLSFNLSGEEEKELQFLSDNFSESKLQDIIEQLMKTEGKMKYASITQLPLELSIMKICGKN